MRIGRIPALSALVIATMGITASVAHANPAPDLGVQYSTVVGADGRSVQTTLSNGTFRLTDSGRTVDVVDSAGTVVVHLPLAYSVRGSAFPIAADLTADGTSLKLTPETADVAGALPLHDVDARSDAYNNMIRQWQLGWSRDGGLSAGIGTAIGIVVGCVLVFFAACIPGAVVGGILGAAAGVAIANPDFPPAVSDFLTTY
ncbi:hypothetical protein [Antrihabitans sp. YC2-6]|uniref:hypothetical protein n=1 Tax=Antrihabitans sp. YC2-6 TaxID=2799498 RepID=UPI0018F4EB9F|nr:hypothetical protein [Antrihabitans sp. YC2-6]MBJ8348154.1 hypothetical protein [Antrihabitans sp. YC2-6]